MSTLRESSPGTPEDVCSLENSDPSSLDHQYNIRVYKEPGGKAIAKQNTLALCGVCF